MLDITSIMKKIDALKPIPQVAHKIMSIVEDPESSLPDLSKVIGYDSAVTANLLKIANSAYFGRPGKFDSIHQAIVYFGMDHVVDLVLLASAADNLKHEQTGYDLQKGDLWRYSVFSALIARELAQSKGIGKTHLIFTAALLKDIGKVILGQYVGDAFKEINTMVVEQYLTFREAEKLVIGIDHAELGGMVAKSWNFGSKMVEIIQNHHQPQKSSLSEIESSIVYLADTICMMMGVGGGLDGLAYRFQKEVVHRLEFTEWDLQEIMAISGEKLQHIESLVSMP
ncbi:MAG: HDOD domain-containing protein [Deltaproteobacteria bacterium]|nr:HDOD domain-containing protein [Deltaproteobacteria bacterium]